MTHLRRLVLLLTALGLASFAAPALAAAPKGDCLWKTLPQTRKTELLDSYRAKGLESLQEIQVDDALTLKLRQACNFSADEDYAAGEILGAILVERGAELMLSERNQIAMGAMDRVWRGLAPADRDAMTAFGLAVMANKNDGAEAAAAIIVRVSADLGLPTTQMNTDVFAYLIARAIREAREKGIT
ncbi:MAG: hypothetical protein EON95_17550 [Caulobacteraceae bacterium]|nr:MAG: hypothetical protein EON95_17550 [Caulobacteraceae bacterium]